MSSYPQFRTFVHIVIHISTTPSCLNANMEVDATLCRVHTCHLQPYHMMAHYLFGLHVIAPFKTSCRRDGKRILVERYSGFLGRKTKTNWREDLHEYLTHQ